MQVTWGAQEVRSRTPGGGCRLGVRWRGDTAGGRGPQAGVKPSAASVGVRGAGQAALRAVNLAAWCAGPCGCAWRLSLAQEGLG